jgi:DNA-binding GntR family transcriptional regulator
MKQKRRRTPAPLTRLQQEVADGILRALRADGVAPGTHLTESALAARLRVSRTPVRAALDRLAAEGIVARRPNRGVALLVAPPAPPGGDPGPGDGADQVEAAMVRVARDRETGELPDEISEAELMRRYALGRADVQRVLARFADLGMVARRPGYGWEFVPSVLDAAVREESYRFRLIVEPAALLEPGFVLDPVFVADMRRRHQAVLAGPWDPAAAVRFFEMNAAFHEGLAAASGNRFLLASARRQNQMRRLSNYRWGYGTARVAVSCREHLEILDRLERGDREVAAVLMRRHLAGARDLRRQDGID